MLKIYTKKLLSEILRNKGFIAIFFVSLVLLTASIIVPLNKSEVKQEKVLGVSTTPKPTLIPSPTASPSPKLLAIVPISTPTPTPTPSPSSTSTPTPSPTSTPSNNSSTPTPTPTPTPSPTPTSTPTPSPTPASLTIHIGVSYAGQKTSDSYTVSVQPGKTAWDVLLSAPGLSIEYETYDWGIFIKGFNGVSAAPNQFYGFNVNGGFSNVGVSDYTVNDGDQLDFVLTSF